MFKWSTPGLLLLLLLSWLATMAAAQGDTLGLQNGYINLKTANFDLQLVHDAQVLASLKASGGSFDFLPFGYLPVRAGNGQYHWGDVTFRYRAVGSTAWISGDSSTRRAAVTSLSNATNANVLASANMAPTLPTNTTGLGITRTWLDVDGDLALSFTLTNRLTTSMEIGSLGFPAEFNNIFTNYSAAQTQQFCSLSDPYIGMHAGYIRVNPINGNGAALVVTPLATTNTPMEAYRNLVEPYYDSTAYGSQVFEGLYEWQTLSKAWAENEWKNTQPWNPASSRVLAPGASLTFGLKFSLAKGGIRTVDEAVQAQGVPNARGIPGYIIPQDLTAQLVINPGSAGTIVNTTVSPAGAFTVSQAPSSSSSSSIIYNITPSSTAFGRARLTIAYSSGQLQTVHYYLVPSGPTHLANMGNFLTTKQYYTNTSDPFGRAPSVISYDHDLMRPVLQDDRVWIAGLSDEAGAGSFLAAAMKQAVRPDATEIAKLEAFVDGVLFKTLQNANYTVRKSVFYYGLAGYPYSTSLSWTGWESWNQAAAYATDRAYDYVHVAATYWALYRAGRAYPATLTRGHDALWYLNQAYQTVLAVTAQNSRGGFVVGYADVGLMGETVFGEILKDLSREGLNTQAATLEARMKVRAQLWSTMADPFGSEMAWDSTGQEGVYYWSRHFNLSATSAKTLGTVVGFQPTVAHWGWNGNARRYWDNLYGGKLRRIERQIHHYGSGLNALVALAAFRADVGDSYLLRIGYGGMNGPLTNIHADGFAAASFHSFPDTLAWDAYSGDYGPNHVGLVLGTGTYIVNDVEDGRLVAYGGQVTTTTTTTTTVEDGSVTVLPRDVARRKVFVGPLGLLVELDAGAIMSVVYAPGSDRLQMTLGQLDGVPVANSTVVWLSRDDGAALRHVVTGNGVTTARLGWRVPLGSGGGSSVVVDVVPS